MWFNGFTKFPNEFQCEPDINDNTLEFVEKRSLLVLDDTRKFLVLRNIMWSITLIKSSWITIKIRYKNTTISCRYKENTSVILLPLSRIDTGINFVGKIWLLIYITAVLVSRRELWRSSKNALRRNTSSRDGYGIISISSAVSSRISCWLQARLKILAAIQSQFQLDIPPVQMISASDVKYYPPDIPPRWYAAILLTATFYWHLKSKWSTCRFSRAQRARFIL